MTSRDPSQGETPDSVDAAVLADSILGLAIALELSGRDATVAVYARPSLLAGASPPVPLIASPQVFAWEEPVPVRELAIMGSHLFPAFVETIESASGLSCDFDARGGVAVARDDEEEVLLDRGLDWQRQAGFPIEVMTGEEAAEREPALDGENLSAAFFLPLGGQVSSERLFRALLLALSDAGVALHLESPVQSANSVTQGRWAVDTGGKRVLAAALIDATSGNLPVPLGLPRLPLFRHEVISARLDFAAVSTRPARFILNPSFDLVPERTGYVHITGRPGKSPNYPILQAERAAALFAASGAAVPASRSSPLSFLKALSEPFLPDGIPALGETAAAGLFVAQGLSRHSLIMVPAAAVFVADLLTGQKPDLPLSLFSPLRFRP